MKYLFLILFWAFTVIHLIDSWKDDSRRRAMTKPLLLLFLLLFYGFSTDTLNWVLAAALLTSWLGDVLLIPKGHDWFTAGGISFMLSHFLFIAVYIPAIRFSLVPWLLVVPMAVLYYGISFAIIWAVQPSTPKVMVVPMYVYLLANSTMNLFALMQMVTTRSLGGVVAYVGAVFFFISDCTLFLVRYHRNKELIFKKHFTVMLTYLVGEFLIALGILLLNMG